MRRLRVRSLLCAAACLGLSVGAFFAGQPVQARQLDGGAGQWSAPFSTGTIAIHSILMPNGKVLLFQRPSQAFGSDARVFDPGTGQLTDVSLQSARDVFCSGHTLLADGRILITGGHVHHQKGPGGVADTNVFDPVTDTWTTAPSLSEARWYPTNVELSDGSTLVFGGQHALNDYATTVDEYDPAATTMTTLPATATKQVGLYPRLHLLPDGRIYWTVGEKKTQGKQTYFFTPSTNAWSTGPALVQYPRNAGDSVLLPGLQKILVMGGTIPGPTVTNSAEILDLSQPTPKWRLTAPMTYARAHANAVLLADGTVLAVGGGTSALYGNPQLTPELFDPVAETWTPMAPQAAPRVYHSTAILLPDGRVLSAGEDFGTQAKTGEIFSPPYLFKGPRPMIASAPSYATYGQGFTISTPDAKDIRRVALVAPGSVTHAMDSGQRYVDLTFSQADDGTIAATAPANGNQAPPGWYMLFVLNSAGVPSVASWVHLDASGQPGGGHGSPAGGGLPSVGVGGAFGSAPVGAAPSGSAGTDPAGAVGSLLPSGQELPSRSSLLSFRCRYAERPNPRYDGGPAP